jgi:Domain of unknown function (DUF5069)
MAGVAMLARTIDKARAQLAGTLGEYIYDCPMDRRLFATIGVSGGDFLAAVERSSGDDGVVAWLRERGPLPYGDALAAHNEAIDGWRPQSDGSRARFAKTLAAVAPGRDDIVTWTDLIDVEEGRLVTAYPSLTGH